MLVGSDTEEQQDGQEAKHRRMIARECEQEVTLVLIMWYRLPGSDVLCSHHYSWVAVDARTREIEGQGGHVLAVANEKSLR